MANRPPIKIVRTSLPDGSGVSYMMEIGKSSGLMNAKEAKLFIEELQKVTEMIKDANQKERC